MRSKWKAAAAAAEAEAEAEGRQEQEEKELERVVERVAEEEEQEEKEQEPPPAPKNRVPFVRVAGSRLSPAASTSPQASLQASPQASPSAATAQAIGGEEVGCSSLVFFPRFFFSLHLCPNTFQKRTETNSTLWTAGLLWRLLARLFVGADGAVGVVVPAAAAAAAARGHRRRRRRRWRLQGPPLRAWRRPRTGPEAIVFCFLGTADPDHLVLVQLSESKTEAFLEGPF